MSRLFASGGQSTGASASSSVLPMSIQELISFRVDWFDLLAVQGALKSLLQHHSSKASILWCSAFFMVQLSHLYMTTGPLTIWIFVGNVMSPLFNMLSRFVIAILPRNKFLLISLLQSPSAVILEPKKIVCHYFHSPPPPPSICHEKMGLDAMILVFAVHASNVVYAEYLFSFWKLNFGTC